MGVHGLWKLIESSGKPIPIETLENKVLAVDISIWLHQAIKGFQDYKGAPVANAHLLGIYHRVCKLLYFKIKPVFVFDGGVPFLKRQTIVKRNQLKSRNASEADRLQKQLLSTLLKHTAISKVLSEKAKASLNLPKKTSGKYDNLYALPSSSFDSTISSSDEEEEETTDSTTDSSPTKQWDLHTIDTTSIYFKSLPLEAKHEILTELKETRKQNSWAKLHQLPKQSDDFSTYQMKRLLKRQEVQAALDEVSQEMGGMSLSLAELESLLKDQGIKTTNDANIGKRIASDDSTRYLLIKDIHKELKKAEEVEKIKENLEKINEEKDSNLETIDEEEDLKKAIELSLEVAPSTSKGNDTKSNKKSIADLEEEEELKKAIQLSMKETSNSNKSKYSFLDSFNDGDFQSDSDSDYETTSVHEENVSKKLSSAQSYMLEYSGLTPNEIEKIINNNNTKDVSKSKQVSINVNKETQKIRKNDRVLKLTHKTEVNYDLLESKPGKKCESLNKSEDVKFKELPDKTENKPNYSSLGIIPEEKSESLDKVENVDTNEVEIMSDSESSMDDLELIKASVIKPSFEIVIDPTKNEYDDDDDLFGDIFDKEIKNENVTDKKLDIFKDDALKEKVSPNKSVEIIVDPKLNVHNDDLFDDIFSENKPLSESPVTEDKEKHVDTQNVKFTGISASDEKFATANKTDETVANTSLNKKEESIEIIENKDTTEPKIPKLTVAEMEEMKDSLQNEKIELLREKSNKERLANNITDQMYQEAQELLELFGVPYVIAPMEAEAQCAFLDEIELTDGSITDDSDIWLFGGRTVYKNFFNQSKYVMEFKAENIEHHFKLNRQQMILLALLVGSDYTTGLQGVGAVTALEILASFPPAQTKEFSLSHRQLISGLKEFKSWFLKGKTPGPGRSTLKNKLKNITFTDNFPSSQVVEAYLEPKVETSRDRFSWSKPDVTSLTIFAKEKFGWTMKKTEEILNPVMQKIEENQTQKSIKDYFKTKFKVNPVDLEGKVSKRVKTAIDKIGKTPDELIAEEMAELEQEKERALKKTHSKTTGKPKSTSNKKKKTDDTSKVTINKECLKDLSSSDPLEHYNLEDVNQTSSKAKKEEKKPKKKLARKEKGMDLKLDTTESRPLKKARTKKETSENKKSDNKLKSLEEINELKDYEELAVALKTRRKRKNELLKIKIDETSKKKQKLQPPVDKIPKELEEDEEIKILTATTSQSNQRVDAIKNEVLKSLEKAPPKKKVPIPTSCLHTKEVIHQKLRDNSNLLKNKLKAIEVFRKSTKGPGYVPKRNKHSSVPKEDAGLSEDSD